MIQKRRTYWRLTVAAVAAVSVASFTPLVLDPVDAEPWLLGLPHTLWAGILVACALVALAWVGTRVHVEPDDEEAPA